MRTYEAMIQVIAVATVALVCRMSVGAGHETVFAAGPPGLAAYATVRAAWSPLSFQADDNGRLICTRPDAQVLWVFDTGQKRRPTFELAPQGRIIVNGTTVLDRSGRLLAHMVGHGTRDRSGERGSGPAWDPLTQLQPPFTDETSDSMYGPLFDSAGNAWLLVVHYGPGICRLEVMRSNAHDGTWQPAETIYETSDYVGRPGIVIDPVDRITVLFRRLADANSLEVMRYIPGSGWSGPETIYTGPFFQAPELAGDADGNLMASFDGPDWTMYTVIYDASAGTWGPATQLSPSNGAIELPTLHQNTDGSAVYAVYWVTWGSIQRGVYAHRFDSVTKTWEVGVHLQGSDQDALPGGIGPFSRIPGVVDRDGEATVPYYTYDTDTLLWTLHGNRTQGGVWQPGDEILAPDTHTADLQNFAGTDSSASGDVFVGFQRYDLWTTGQNNIWAIHYDAAGGQWEPPALLETHYDNLTTRVRIAFRGADNAVATFRAFQGGQYQAASALFDGTNWVPGLLDIPNTYEAYNQESASDAGEVLLWFEGEGGPWGPHYGIFATWLRPITGDLDGDDDVDLSDLAALLAAYGTCVGDPNYNPAADFDGSGCIDLPDLAALLANYGVGT